MRASLHNPRILVTGGTTEVFSVRKRKKKLPERAPTVDYQSICNCMRGHIDNPPTVKPSLPSMSLLLSVLQATEAGQGLGTRLQTTIQAHSEW